MFSLEGKTAFVTGAGSGIGLAIANAYVKQGAQVVVADRDEDAGIAAARQIGDGAIFRLMDVCDYHSIVAAYDWTLQEMGRLDILVNNAGLGFVGNIQETPEADFLKLHQVNVFGVYVCCQHAIPIMLDQGAGNIINVASVLGLVGVERRFAYCSTKGAIVAQTRQLAIDYADKGIRVNAIAPGTVETPFVESYLQRFHAGEIEETRQKLNARHPIGRIGQPEDIAALAVYLASDESSFMTGSILPIDGGWTAR